MALNGKAGESWERIFGTPKVDPVAAADYMAENPMPNFLAAVEAKMRGLSAQIEAEDRRLLSGHYGNPMDVAYLPCDCGPDDCPCCCRCGLED